MFQVTTVHLSTDGARAAAAFGTVERGALAGDALQDLLENFRFVDGVENHESDPQVIVGARSGRFIVRTGRQKLFLYNARDPLAPYTELTAAEIVACLQRPAVTQAPFPGTEEPLTPPAPKARHRGIAAMILVLGIALNGYTVYSSRYTESVNELPAVTLITDPSELITRQHDVVGTFATGAQKGDRVIEVARDGSIKFSEIDSPKGLGNGSDTYQLGRLENRLCLITRGNGVVNVVNIETMMYYGDTYRRTK